MLLLSSGLAVAQPVSVAAAQRAVDAGDPVSALEITKVLLSTQPENAAALLIQSTAHLMLGDLEVGEQELDRALQLDPALRQGWLNRAALSMAASDYPAALAAFEQARQLDPGADDNHLNLGATRLLMGDLDAAAQDFERYLQRSAGNSEAFYLVATNYAMGGYAAFALRHLHQAIKLDERSRRRARRDPNFVSLEDHPRFQDLMNTDIYVLSSDSHRAARVFKGAYDGGRGVLLQSVLDALYGLREPFDPNVEVTENWALIWGRYRIKLRQDLEGGVVELTAPQSAFTATEWEQETKRLFDSVFVQIPKRL